jgi:RNA polymerase sigma-70 factor (ECF subfamily)
MSNTPSATDSEDRLIVAIALGGRHADSAVTTLFSRFAGPFKGRAMRRGLNEADAEDVIQDAFVKIVKSSDRFQPKGEGSAWLWCVFNSVLADAQRKSQRAPPMEDYDAVPENFRVQTDGSCQLDFQECVQTQMNAFGVAWPEGLQVILWSASHGMKTRQIAEIIQRSEGATREFLSQVRKKFKTFVEQCDELLES